MGFFDRFRKAPALTSGLTEKIRRSFNDAAADEEHFPCTIDPRILHVHVILETLQPRPGKRILDAGCGKGRFARVVAESGASVHGMDLAEAMLRFVEPPLHACAASLTALPYAGASFDGAYATESLEHAVEIEKAVAELCRVVKPGGAIVVIDKNKEQWGRLDTPEWERWFGAGELTAMLRRHCRSVESRPISYWEDVAPDGLFLVWIARK